MGATLVGVGLAVAATARGYEVGFVVDPVGPRAVPYLVAGLLILGGVGMLRRRPTPLAAATDDGLPTGALGSEEEKEAQVPDPVQGRPVLAQGACVGVLVLYAASIPLLGFVVPTVLASGALARLFGGRWLHGLGVGLFLGLSLYGLFAWGFGLELPVGALLGGGS
jgi:putative tricarboxylic transport membrane protein